MQWVTHLVTGLSPQKSAFETMPVCLGSVGDKVALGHAFFWVLWLSTVGIILPMLHTHSSIFHQCYIISAIEKVSSNNTLPFSVSLCPFLDAGNAMLSTYNSLPLLHQLLLLSQFCHIYQFTASSGVKIILLYHCFYFPFPLNFGSFSSFSSFCRPGQYLIRPCVTSHA